MIIDREVRVPAVIIDCEVRVPAAVIDCEVRVPTAVIDCEVRVPAAVIDCKGVAGCGLRCYASLQPAAANIGANKQLQATHCRSAPGGESKVRGAAVVA